MTIQTKPDEALERVLVESIADEAAAEASATRAPASVESLMITVVDDRAVPAAEQLPKPAAEEPKRADEILFILESGDMERTWAALIMANGAAASGVKVNLFLTFWGFYPLVKPGVRITGENWMQKMLAFMNRPGIDHLKMSRLNFAGMGPWMAGRLAKSHNVALPSELLEAAMALGVRLLPCQMSMDLFGITRDDLVDGLEEPVGVATVIEMITRGVPAIFI